MSDLRSMSSTPPNPGWFRQLIWVAGLIVIVVNCGSLADEPTKGAKNEAHKQPNALIHSSSPYLLQHAHNPVNWMPWGPEAFAKAKAENKPIFVSIGYSTCYWCHVMERESFEDEAVAELLNEHYVAIKVDREQRPDIDEQLMLATQLLTGRGGWPNSVWLTVDGRPWMAGTYFPRETFMKALTQLARVWDVEAEAVETQADSLSAAVRSASQVRVPPSRDEAWAKPLGKALAELKQTYDARHGGFGDKPKFPPHGSLRLLAAAARDGAPQALNMLVQTLNAMWRGGIHDHVGGGFHRYSTDEHWLLPHFEKMLYDNAQLMRAYAEAYELTAQDKYRTAVQDIFAWVQREMTSPTGGFYSALDSESEGEEGRFNTWSMQELNAVLTPEESRLFGETYNFSAAGNYIEEASGNRTGRNIPFLSDRPNAETTTAILDSEPPDTLATLPARLLVARDQRVRPHLDDKVLTSWNGLMISSLAFAGRILDAPELINTAERAAQFLLDELRDEQGLLHAWRAGQASVPGYLDDYAFLIDGLLELHLATQSERWLNDATSLSTQMLQRFEDQADGGFFFTSELHELLLVRSKNLLGGGNLPVGNGVAIQNLIMLNRLTGDELYLEAAQRGLRAFSGLMRQTPRQVEHLVLAAAQYASLLKDSTAAHQLGTQRQVDDIQHSEAITARVYLSHLQRAPGQRVKIAVEVEIAPGYHLYGEPAKAVEESLVQPTRLQWESDQGLLCGTIQATEGSTKLDPVLNTEVTLYAGSMWFYLPVEILENATLSNRKIGLKLTFQACDQTRCLQPQTLLLSPSLTISPLTDAQPRHTDLFERW